MATWATIEGHIRTWITDALFVSGTGARQVPVIFGNEAGPRPTTPYVAILAGGPRQVGHDDRRTIDEDGVQDMVGDRLITVSVQVFGAGAMDLARTCCNKLNTENARGKLAKQGIAVQGAPVIQDLTALLEVGAEKRAQFDAVFAYAEEYEDDLGLIEKVSGTGKYVTPVQEHEIDFEAEKPGYVPPAPPGP